MPQSVEVFSWKTTSLKVYYYVNTFVTGLYGMRSSGNIPLVWVTDWNYMWTSPWLWLIYQVVHVLNRLNTSYIIPLPVPLTPPYLPTKPVSMIWSSKHSTERLYRYTHFERIVYPHERVIVPPAYNH